MKRNFKIWLAGLGILSLALRAGAQGSSGNERSAPLVLTAQVPLTGVRGRFDHLAFDPVEPARIFISALGNNSLEVINLVEGTEVHRITGIPEPQGVAYAPGLNKIFVGSRKGTLYVYDGSSYSLIASIAYNADVDNLRYDAASKRVYVGYGDGEQAAIGMIDATTNKRLGEEYKTGVHPESFQLETSGNKIYVNLEDAKQVGVIDRATKKMSKWPLPNHFEENFPMALDEADHRLFIVTRTPPRLVVFDTDSAKLVATLPCVADVDDLYYDSSHKRVYIPGGQGSIDVFQQRDAGHFEHLARIPSVIGARTAGYTPKIGKKGQNRFYLAVPNTPGRDAAVWVYTVEE
ncbi:MAG TPA: YncE family protein [Verrucomicrobiae bacterium]|jgi:DNA-binding beta-propeller fold protein YncE|nr:YncE family protein [Verrucomicrobiae bacterium]